MSRTLPIHRANVWALAILIGSLDAGVALNCSGQVPPLPPNPGAVPAPPANLLPTTPPTNALRGPFLEALGRADLDSMRGALGRDPSLANVRDDSGEPVLVLAASGLQTNVVRLLLEAGAAVDATNQWSRQTALRAAVAPGLFSVLSARSSPAEAADRAARLTIASILLEYGASVFAPDVTGAPLIHQAGRHGDGQFAEYLLAHARPGDRGGTDGNTPLHLAALWGHTTAVQSLIGKGADIEATNSASLTPLGVVARLRCPDDNSFLTRLNAAGRQSACSNKQFIADQLLDAGAVLDIFSAAGLGRTQAIRRLLTDSPFLVRTKDSAGRTPLHWAVEAGTTNGVLWLIKAGAPLEAADTNGLISLDLAVQLVDPAVASQLVSHGASVHRPSGLTTPLHRAAQVRYRLTLDLLLGAGADKNALNEQGRTPLDLAIACGSEAVTRRLFELRARYDKGRDGVTTPIHWATVYDKPDFIRLFRNDGVDINARDAQGKTALHRAIETIHGASFQAMWSGPPQPAIPGVDPFAMVNTLLQHGADINRGDTNGDTVLHHRVVADNDLIFVPPPPPGAVARTATRLRRVAGLSNVVAAVYRPAPPPTTRSLIGFLLDHGASVNATNSLGCTPLHRVAEKKFTGTNAVEQAAVWIRPLCKPRALLEARDTAGWTPLHAAAASGNQPVMEALLALGANPNAMDACGQTVLWRLMEQESHRSLFPLLFKHGAKPDARDASGRTCLHVAAESCHLPLVEMLLRCGVSANVRDSDGLTPLHLALERQACPRTIDLLLAHDADINAPDKEGRSPLMRAFDVPPWDVGFLNVSRKETPSDGPPLAGTWAVNAKFVASLLRRGLRLEQQDGRGRTVLHLAARQGQAPLVELLLGQRANPDAQDAEGDTPLHVAIREAFMWSNKAVIDALLAHSNNHAITNRSGETPLRVAILEPFHSELVDQLIAPGKSLDFIFSARGGNIAEVTKYLQRESALANLAEAGGFTPLNAAIEGNSIAVVKLLLDHNARPNGRVEEDWAYYRRELTRRHQITKKAFATTGSPPIIGLDWAYGEEMRESPWGASPPLRPLATAVRHNRREIASLLVERGADVDLHSAVWLGNVERTRALLNESPFDLTNRYFWEGETLLHAAARGGQVETMRVLLERKIDPLILDGHGHTAYFIAMTHTQHVAGRLLEDYGAGKDAVTLASIGSVEKLATLVEKDPSRLSATNVNGQTPLLAAVTLAQLPATEWLLKHGASVNAQNSSGATALHMACRIRRADFVRLLLDHDADVSLTDARGCTPLHLAVLEGNEELTRLLLSAGANSNASIKDTATEPQPCEGETPLHIAALRCSTNLMSALLAAGAHVNATNHGGLTPLGLLHNDRSIAAPGGVRYFRPALRYQAMGYIAVDAATRLPEELKAAKLYLIGKGAVANSATLNIPQNGPGPPPLAPASLSSAQ